jgi:hypothetical protein
VELAAVLASSRLEVMICVSVPDLKNLHSTAEQTVRNKKELFDEGSKIKEDKNALLKLSGTLHVLSRDDTLRARLREGWEDLDKRGERVESKLRATNAQETQIRNDAFAAMSRSQALLERVRQKGLSRADRSALRQVEKEQSENINSAKSILAKIDGSDPAFGDILRLTRRYYENAEVVSDFHYENNDTRNFTGHTMRHIAEVRGKTRDLLSSMRGKVFAEDDFFSDKTFDAAVAFHDTGMDANLPSNLEPWALRAFAGKGLPGQKNIGDIGAVDNPRDRHAVSGAIRLLEHRDELAAKGVDVDRAAFLITLHSKRGFLENGAARDLSDISFTDIERAAANFKRECENEKYAGKGIHWDDSWLQNDNAKRQTAVSASILRLADANRDGVNLYSQTGKGYSFDNKEACKGRETILGEERYKEIADMFIASDGKQGREEIRGYANPRNEEEKRSNETRGIVFGEHNVDFMDLGVTKEGKFVYRFTVNEPEIGVGCTVHVIQERLDEIRASVFGKLEMFGGKASDYVIEVFSDNGSVKRLTDCLDIPYPWHLAYEE